MGFIWYEAELLLGRSCRTEPEKYSTLSLNPSESNQITSDPVIMKSVVNWLKSSTDLMFHSLLIQMNVSGSTFYSFTSNRTEQLPVVFRRFLTSNKLLLNCFNVLLDHFVFKLFVSLNWSLGTNKLHWSINRSMDWCLPLTQWKPVELVGKISAVMIMLLICCRIKSTSRGFTVYTNSGFSSLNKTRTAESLCLQVSSH